jgi:hypothetical protein
MYSKPLFVLFVCFSVTLCSCNPRSNTTQAVSAKIDSAYAQIADLKMEQLKLSNKVLEDPKITAAIQEYANAKTTADKDRIIEIAKPPEIPTDTRPAPNEKPTKGGIEFASFLDKISPEAFDLAIRNNDVVVQQVRLMNNYFGGLDSSTMNAMAYYEQLPTDQKVKFFLNEQEFKPVPDYQQRWLGREFRNAYLLQRLLLLNHLNQYLARTKYINEFPQGFKQNMGTSLKEDEKQFDLVISHK